MSHNGKSYKVMVNGDNFVNTSKSTVKKMNRKAKTPIAVSHLG